MAGWSVRQHARCLTPVGKPAVVDCHLQPSRRCGPSRRSRRPCEGCRWSWLLLCARPWWLSALLRNASITRGRLVPTRARRMVSKGYSPLSWARAMKTQFVAPCSSFSSSARHRMRSKLPQQPRTAGDCACNCAHASRLACPPLGIRQRLVISEDSPHRHICRDRGPRGQHTNPSNGSPPLHRPSRRCHSKS